MGIAQDIRPRRDSKRESDIEIDHKPEPEIKPAEVIELEPPKPPVNKNTKSSNKIDQNEFFKSQKIKNNKGKSHIKFIIILIILALVLISIAVYQNLDLIKRRIYGEDKQYNPTTKSESINEPTTTSETSQQAASQSTIIEDTTTQAVAPAVPDKNSFTIRVSNGSGITGSASKVSNTLKTAGFQVKSVGNAANFSYPTTIVYFKDGKSAEANLVAAAITGRSVTTELSATLKSYDILIVVGAK